MNYDQLKHLVESKDHKWFESGQYDLNIIGIRNTNAQVDRFQDAIYVAYINNQGKKCVKNFVATTRTGLPYLLKPLNSKGAFILATGQHRALWRIGKHRGKIPALVQSGIAHGYRDNDRDAQFDHEVKDSGWFGINLHPASKWWRNIGTNPIRSIRVGKWSAGCQVLAYQDDMNLLLELAKQQVWNGHGKTFSYTLIEI